MLFLALVPAWADECACEGSLVPEYGVVEPCDESVAGGCSCDCVEDEDGQVVCSNDAGPLPEGTSCDPVGEICMGESDCTDDVIYGDEGGCSQAGGQVSLGAILLAVGVGACRRGRRAPAAAR